MSTSETGPGHADIHTLVAEVCSGEIGPGQFQVLGGIIPAESACLVRLLGCFKSIRLDHGLWHHSHRIRFDQGIALADMPPEPELLERARLFGAGGSEPGALPAAGGDLELRRDGEQLRWRFVGAVGSEPAKALRLAGIAALDFWVAQPAARLRMRSQRLLLWGEAKGAGGRFCDDRVGWADLTYPVAKAEGRAELRYLEFSHAGQPAFVWWLEVDKHG